MTVNHSIDPADRVEPVEIIKTSTSFVGKIIINNKAQALTEARKDLPGLTIWTDGSKLSNGRCGASVCWKDMKSKQWRQKSVFLGKNKEILDAELWAISEALDTAIRETSTAHNTLLTIFCDSQRALMTIWQPPLQKENRFLRAQIYYKVEKPKTNGHTVICRWVPGHTDLIGNEKADFAARDKAEKGGRQAERWSSLAHIRENLAKVRSTEITKWYEKSIQEREVSRRGFYIPWTKGAHPILGNIAKKYAARFYQLKVGHGAVGTYLARIGRIESPQCWWCREQVQTVEHLYTKCRRWRKERRRLVRELGKEGVTWQAQAERRWLAGLLANEKAVTPLLRFLEVTEVGAREGAREREAESERKNDRAGKDLL